MEQSNIQSFDQYAIFQKGKKQYQALPGKTIAIDRVEGEQGAAIEFTEVLMRKMGPGAIEIGQPFVKATVKAEIVKQDKGPKLTVFKFKRRKKSRVKKGYRSDITVIRIISI
jgi:large subunit ribosomal protein L21